MNTQAIYHLPAIENSFQRHRPHGRGLYQKFYPLREGPGEVVDTHVYIN